MEDYSDPKKFQKRFEDYVKRSELETIVNEGLQVLKAQKGLMCCKYTVPKRLSDENGNWHVGALATLVDDIANAAAFSRHGDVGISVDYSISYYCTAKIHEEVEIEAKVVGDKVRLISVVVEVRRKDCGELIALAKQWMASTNKKPKIVAKL